MGSISSGFGGSRHHLIPDRVWGLIWGIGVEFFTVAWSRPRWRKSGFTTSQTRVAVPIAAAPSVHTVTSRIEPSRWRLQPTTTHEKIGSTRCAFGAQSAERRREPPPAYRHYEPPARPFRSAMRTHISNASPHTPDPPRRSRHMLTARCSSESRAVCVQMLSGLSCNRRARACPGRSPPNLPKTGLWCPWLACTHEITFYRARTGSDRLGQACEWPSGGSDCPSPCSGCMDKRCVP